MNNLIDKARLIPIDKPKPAVSISSVTLPMPGRNQPLEMRITAPVTGTGLPIILLCHGHGPSLYLPSKDGYGPLVNFYAEHGFAVIQPTQANSKVAGFAPDAPGAPLFWRARIEEMKHILDHLNEIEAQPPIIAGRLDHDKISAIGHSAGAQTVGMLLGARLNDPKDTEANKVNAYEPRIKAGILLAAPGNGGNDLSEFAREHYSALSPDYSHLKTRTLVVYGDQDVNPHLTVRGADWHADPYHFSPGSDSLLTLFGAKHGLGGIAGYDAKETDDEDPDRLVVTQRMTWAYLNSALNEGNSAWSKACEALTEHAGHLGCVEQK
ncbi:alpha/beta fold hydrolase [Microbulbifer sp. OS29]|uniref:Alpha/beta fold hydrolase n=1 Tax=Microbulbifer okhotskensis TaxID=2926617 RepID=A0A9X2ELC2_9GAMM|nr:alpha/beta fold hydrolase [Microbulbifer okhotskensis]MCO1333791.1 alpha/beta fold hydrolase [Microbulbifer okhotskensis]